LVTSTSEDREKALRPEDLTRLVVRRLNSGDVEGLVALYEPDATLVTLAGQSVSGLEEIRRVFSRIVGSGVTADPGTERPTLRSGDLALTSTRLSNGTVTVEVARRQQDGTWLWVIDHPAFLYTTSADDGPGVAAGQ
jgi:ketosteroid isomerase-like protein